MRMVALLPALACLFGSAFTFAADPPLRVVCPAIRHDEANFGSAPISPFPVELVVVGKATPIKKPGEERAEEYDIAIDRVLYGHAAGKTIRVAEGFAYPEPGKVQIFAIQQDQYGGLATTPRLELRRVLPVTEEKSQRAIARARMDYYAAAADAVVVARELPRREYTGKAGDDDDEDFVDLSQTMFVQVENVLHGEGIKKGDRLQLRAAGQAGPPISKEPMICFLEGREVQKPSKVTVHGLATRLPAACEAQVKDALTRRDKHPIIDTDEDGEKERLREVLFDGTLDEAIELLGAEHAAAVTLGARKLIVHKAESAALIIKAIDGYMLDHTYREDQQNHRLHALILLLHSIGETSAGGAADKLLAKLLAHIATNPASPAQQKRSDGWLAYQTEDQFDDINHSLAWLASSIGEVETERRHGDALLAARDKAAGAWRSEIQLALDAAKVEATRETTAALAKSKETKPARYEPRVFHDGPYAVAWSPDGKWFAAAGYGTAQVWSAADFARAGKFTIEGSIDAIRFSRDGKSLYIGGGAQRHTHFRADWRAGKAEQTYTGHVGAVSSMQLSADEKVMVTASHYDEKLHIWEMPAGRVARTIEIDHPARRIALSPDGKTLLHEVARGQWLALTLDDATKPAIKLAIDCAVFAPDGKTLYTATCEPGEDEYEARRQPRLRITARKPAADFAPSGEPTAIIAGNHIAISNDGSRLATGVIDIQQQSLPITIFGLPDFKPVATCTIPTRRQLGNEYAAEAADFALSPDGKRLLVASSYSPPLLFDTQTGKQINPNTAHIARIESLSFDAADKLRSLGRDGSECEWNPAMLKLLSRTQKQTEPAEKDYRARDQKWKKLSDGISDDGKTAYRFGGGVKGSGSWTIKSVHVATGAVIKEVSIAAWNQQADMGLVPGGKYLHIGTHIYDRQTLAHVSSALLRGDDIFHLAFTSDGSRYIVVTGSRIFVDNDYRFHDRNQRTLIRIHDTATGRTLAAYPVASRWVQHMALSPDNKRVAVSLDDGSIEVWPVVE